MNNHSQSYFDFRFVLHGGQDVIGHKENNEFATTNVKRHFECGARNFLILSRFLPMSMSVNPGGWTDWQPIEGRLWLV